MRSITFGTCLLASGIFAQSLVAQVARPTVNVPVARPTIKVPGATAPAPSPAPAQAAVASRSTIPAHFTTPSLQFIGTVAGTEPQKSPDVSDPAITGDRDFNISVPVVIKNVPPMYTSALVFCMVMLPQDAAAPNPAFPDRAASNSWSTRAPLTGGGFAGNVIVKLNVNPGYDAGAARIYQCQLDLQGVDRGATFIAEPRRNSATSPIYYVPPIATASPPQAIVTGLVP